MGKGQEAEDVSGEIVVVFFFSPFVHCLSAIPFTQKRPLDDTLMSNFSTQNMLLLSKSW